MRIAVITPVFEPRPDWLAQCHASVRAQTHPCVHFMVADGDGGAPPPGFDGQFIQLPRRYDDCGDTPIAKGSEAAFSQGYEAVAFLDQDCWYESRHVEGLVELHQWTGAEVCTSRRKLYDYQDRFLGVCPDSDGQKFVDTNCYMICRPAAWLCATLATMPAEYHPIGDRYLFHQIRTRGVPHAHLAVGSVCYRTRLRFVFARLGLEPPADAVDDPRVPLLAAKLRGAS